MLFKTVLYELKKIGVISLIVWFFAENESRKFYEHLGGKLVKEKIINKGKDLLLLAYGWTDLSNIQL